MRRKYEAEMTAAGRKKQRGGRPSSAQTPPVMASPVPHPQHYTHEYHHRPGELISVLKCYFMGLNMYLDSIFICH